MSSDQFWSIFTMPIGLMTCFTPLVIAWFIAEKKSQKSPPERKSPPAKANPKR